MKRLLLQILIISNCYFALSQTDNNSKIPKENGLNVLSLGYQIGGITYFGAEYEYRFSRYIGLNTGVGISGFTGGFKLHSCPCRSGPFLNISFKDGGFGKIGTVNAEIGGILVFLDKAEKLGLPGQIGIGKIIYLSRSSKEKIINHGKSIDQMLSFGIGICWYLPQK
jgi:hypothetical protein